MSNILGFASNNCSTMMGFMSELHKLLRNDIPTVFRIGCFCRSFALCSSHCGEDVTFVSRFLFTRLLTFLGVANFEMILNMIQNGIDTEDKIPKLSQTRWLSCENVINVVIEQ